MDQAVDRQELGAFLRARREAMQPEDLGLRRGSRRRTRGLRREEVAEQCDMSADYLARLERGSGPLPSTQMTAAIARGLRLTPAERDHLFMISGHRAPTQHQRQEHVNPGLMRVLDRLQDTPAQIMGPAGETLVQTAPAVALLGDQTHFTGLDRSATYRWFLHADARERYLPEDHAAISRVNVAMLRSAVTRDGHRSRSARIHEVLSEGSPEFLRLWDQQEVGLRFVDVKRFVHPEVGALDLFCETLQDAGRAQSLLIFTASPGTESHDRLGLLSVLGTQFSR